MSKFDLGMAKRTKTCPHCNGKAHSPKGANGCAEGRAWLQIPEGKTFTTKQENNKLKAKRKQQKTA